MNFNTSGVYLIHLYSPIGINHTARHYLGYANNIASRFDKHVAGYGAKMLAAANRRGIAYEIVRIWPGKTELYEHRLKQRKESPRLCPTCNGKFLGKGSWRQELNLRGVWGMYGNHCQCGQAIAKAIREKINAPAWATTAIESSQSHADLVIAVNTFYDWCEKLEGGMRNCWVYGGPRRMRNV